MLARSTTARMGRSVLKDRMALPIAMTRKDRSAAITVVHVSEVKVAVVAIQGEIANLRHPLRRSPALRAAFVGSARHGLVVQGQAHCDTARLCDGDPGADSMTHCGAIRPRSYQRRR